MVDNGHTAADEITLASFSGVYGVPDPCHDSVSHKRIASISDIELSLGQNVYSESVYKKVEAMVKK